MKLVLLTIFLVAAVFAEPEPDPKAITKADSEALIYYNTYGLWPAGYTGYYYTYPSYVWGRKKRSAEAESEPEADPKAITKADSDAWYYYTTHGYWPTGYTGYYYRYPYYYGRKKRSSEPAPDSSAITKADSDAWYHYTTYGSWPVGYTGYYYTHGLYGLYGRKKRSPESEPAPESSAITKADSDAWYHYTTYGSWPVGYTGYYYSHGLYSLYGRKKRSPESEPAPESSAITKADSDAWYYYTTYGHWPVGYTGYYYTHPYVLYGRKKRSPESEPEATPEGKADPYYVSTYYTYPAYYTHSYYPYVWYGK
jgi:hypothetical protein